MFNEAWRRGFVEDIGLVTGGLEQMSGLGFIGAFLTYNAHPSLLRLDSDGNTVWAIDMIRCDGMGTPYTVEATIAGGYIIGGVNAAGRGGASNLVATDSQKGFEWSLLVNTTSFGHRAKNYSVIEEKEDSCFVTEEETTGVNPLFSHTAYMVKRYGQDRSENKKLHGPHLDFYTSKFSFNRRRTISQVSPRHIDPVFISSTLS